MQARGDGVWLASVKTIGYPCAATLTLLALGYVGCLVHYVSVWREPLGRFTNRGILLKVTLPQFAALIASWLGTIFVEYAVCRSFPLGARTRWWLAALDSIATSPVVVVLAALTPLIDYPLLCRIADKQRRRAQ